MTHGSHEHLTESTADDTDPDVNGTVEDHVDAPSCRPGAAPKEGRCVRKVKQFNRFVDEALAGLPPTAALLWLTLFRFAKDGIAKVSQGTLAGRMGVDVKTVQRNLKVLLEMKGLVRIVKQGAKGRGCSHYQLGIMTLEPRAKPDRRKKPPR